MIYECKCDECGRLEDIVRSVDDRDKDLPYCCSKQMRRIISGYRVVSDLEPYLDENLGEKPVWVKSKKHRERLMKEAGVYEKFGKGWR